MFREQRGVQDAQHGYTHDVSAGLCIGLYLIDRFDAGIYHVQVHRQKKGAVCSTRYMPNIVGELDMQANPGVRSYSCATLRIHLSDSSSRDFSTFRRALSSPGRDEYRVTMSFRTAFIPSTLCVDVMPSVSAPGLKQNAHFSRFLSIGIRLATRVTKSFQAPT